MQFSGCSLEFGVDSGCSLVDAVWNSERPSGCSKWMQFRFRSGRVDAASGCTSVFGVSRVDAITSTTWFPYGRCYIFFRTCKYIA